MTTTTWRMRSARAADLESVLELVRACDLPPAGVADQLETGFVIARHDGGLAGTAGLETHGEFGLLRSVAVGPSLRGRGLGAALVDDRIRAARERGLRAVYLLTTTAADWFAARRFEVVDRADVPEPIRLSSEFAETCPASATVMVLRLP